MDTSAMAQLLEQSKRLCAELADLRQALQRTRAETAALLDQAHQTHPLPLPPAHITLATSPQRRPT